MKQTVKSRRTGTSFTCKNGCGLVFSNTDTKSANWKKERDAFDYHEKQGCTMLPRLYCPLGCRFKNGNLQTFKGQKAFRNHLKSKTHQVNSGGLGAETKLEAIPFSEKKRKMQDDSSQQANKKQILTSEEPAAVYSDNFVGGFGQEMEPLCQEEHFPPVFESFEQLFDLEDFDFLPFGSPDEKEIEFEF